MATATPLVSRPHPNPLTASVLHQRSVIIVENGGLLYAAEEAVADTTAADTTAAESTAVAE